METTQLTNISPAELVALLIAENRKLIREELARVVPAAKPQERVLTTEDLMQLLHIESHEGLQAWCKANKIFGKRAGKRNLYLESKVLAVLAK